MIDKNKLQNYLLNFEEDDRYIIWDFMYFADNLYEFNQRLQGRALCVIKKFVNFHNIKQLEYESVMKTYNALFVYEKKQAQKFIFYLCYKKILAYCSFYRLLDFKEIIFSKEEFCNFNYLINLEEKYYKNILKSHLYKLKTPDKYRVLFIHMLEEQCNDKALYYIFNDYFENYKTTLEKENELNPLLDDLKRLRKFFYDIANHTHEDFNNADYILKIISNTRINKTVIFWVFDILQSKGYITNLLINQTINVLRHLLNKDTSIYDYASKIFDSGKPNLWYTGFKRSLIFINCSDPYKRKILIAFTRKFIDSNLYFFLKEFDNSLKNPDKSLSFYTFLEQIEYFKNHINNISNYKRVFVVIQNFYNFYQSYEEDVFSKDGYSTSLLHSYYVVQNIIKGFEVINYNPFDNIPEADKWMFCYKNKVNDDIIKNKIIDFTIIKSKIFREWVKFYLWNKNQEMKSKIYNIHVLSNLLNYIYDLKTGEQYSFFIQEKNPVFDNINLKEIRALKTYILSSSNKTDTINSKISIIKVFLNYISENKIQNIEQGIFIELNSFRTAESNKTPIPDDHLKIIANKIFDISKENKIFQLYQVIFYLLLETEFRSSQILNLNLDCIKSTAKKNEYVIYSETKTSNQEKIYQPISKYVKSCIEEVIRITSDFRENCHYENLKQKLFIIPTKRKGTYKIIESSHFNRFMHRICKELSIPTYTAQNLRDTKMTKSEIYIAMKHLSDAQLSILSGHKSTDITIRYYSMPTITEILEATNGIIIGDVDIKGNIQSDISSSIENNENLVSNKCGYCSADTCTCATNLDCMLCKYFVTTISRRPYFEEQIKIIDYKIPQSRFEHDKEDLLNQKRLLLGYLNKIIAVQEELNGKSK